METVSEFTYLGDRVSAGGGCEAVVTARTRCEGNIGEAEGQEEQSCDEVETVRELTCLGERVSAGGGCEAVVTART